jgi:hypothetical protein
MNIFINAFQQKLTDFVKPERFSLKHLVMFIAANKLFFKTITFVPFLSLVALMFFGAFNSLPYKDHYNTIIMVWGILYLISCGLISTADQQVCNKDLSDYGYGHKRWFIFELRSKGKNQ